MSLRNSRVRTLLSVINRKGLRAGLDEALNVWAKQRLDAPHDVCKEYGHVLGEDRPAHLEPVSGRPLRINWVVPRFGRGSGGMFNILRTIYRLEDWGHTNRIYVAGEGLDSDLATEIARNYFPVKARVEPFRSEIPDSDALVATSWPTAYSVRTLGNTVRKFYFVQDLEYLFHAPGSLDEFAKETYRWNFYGITAGHWIANVLKEQFNMECTPFSFSYDREMYSPSGPHLLPEGKKRILFYSRPSTERRGFELGVLALSLVARQMPEVEVVMVGLRPRSMVLPFEAKIPGILAPEELSSLYRSCNVALVLSHTNLSLLPLELMASGCPIVSNSGPNVEWLLNDQIARLTNATPKALADGIIALLRDDALRARQKQAGIAFAQASDWSSEIKVIESALYAGIRALRSRG